MNRLRYWTFSGIAAVAANVKTNTGAGERYLGKENTQKAISSNDEAPETISTSIDPKVAEFFKDFPEPYRQKAVQRFSSRAGLYRWDLFREPDMQKEKSYARTGIFLEDHREIEELERKKQELDRQTDKEEIIKHFHEREIPDWEKSILKGIPLQAGDFMLWKLVQAASFAVTGMLAVLMGVMDLRRRSLIRWKAYTSMAAGLGLCVWCYAAVAARLMDFGPFDRSVDDRYLLEKCQGMLIESFKRALDFYNGKPWKP